MSRIVLKLKQTQFRGEPKTSLTEIPSFLNRAFSRKTGGDNPLQNIENGNDMIFDALTLVIESLAKQKLIDPDQIIAMSDEYYSSAEFELTEE